VAGLCLLQSLLLLLLKMLFFLNMLLFQQIPDHLLLPPACEILCIRKVGCYMYVRMFMCLYHIPMNTSGGCLDACGQMGWQHTGIDNIGSLL